MKTLFLVTILIGLVGTAFAQAKTNEITKKQVKFKSEGLVLVGNLHLPANFKKNKNKNYRAVVVAGSWTTVKEQMADLYATKLAKEGLVALSFDFRNYGQSEGQPRNYENPTMKTQDLVNAANYLKTLKFINPNDINGVGICASSGYLTTAVANGASFKSISLVAPWLHNTEIVQQVYGEKREILMNKAIKAKKIFAETGKVEYVLGVSSTDETAAMYGPIDYYLNPKRGAIKEWGNQFATMAWQGWLEFDAIKSAEKINIPVQIIHSKKAAVPQGAETFYAKLNMQKNIIWVENANHDDFYDTETQVNDAVKNTAKWFAK
jgi:uncharacterized protein